VVQCRAMTVSLQPELESLIEKEVESGRFESASEVVAAGLRLLAQDANWDNDALESALLRGLESGEAKEMTQSDWDRIGQS
jgi:antitoxin ParD1/3/4